MLPIVMHADGLPAWHLYAHWSFLHSKFRLDTIILQPLCGLTIERPTMLSVARHILSNADAITLLSLGILK